ncbi:MAG: hypothetical protein ACT6FD_07845, partial [Methanosarcinaceae archaeon]
ILFLLSFVAFLSCNNGKLKDKIKEIDSKEKLENILDEKSDSAIIEEKRADMDSILTELESDEETKPEKEDENAVK